MEIVLYCLLLLVGFAALIKGADLFVDGSSSLARIFKVPGVIIGLTIVAMGTSAPELAVSTSAAIKGSNEIALSNVLGSNIFNTLVVLGVCALFHTVPVEKMILKRDFPVCLAVSVLLLFATSGASLFSGKVFGRKVSEDAGMVSRWLGILLLVGFVIYLVVLILDAKRNPVQEEDEKKPMPVWKSFLLILIGLALIVLGGDLVVRSAKVIAAAAGMSETLIGLTVVALGTSLPELVTSTVAARKGEVGMAVGNAVGSSIFNAMLILGVSSAINPFAVNIASVYDMIIQIGVMAIALCFSATGKGISRGKGIVMLLLYVADIVFAVLR
ncbi:MAG: calcium/sodium antiporter [Lachnospiraceae bacterium]|nr:calcium/sodium antiporter [Lachnospiraceae bacterium]